MASKRNYLTKAELEEYADITVTDDTEAFDQISQAEELIDRWVGPQHKAYDGHVTGQVSSVASTVVYDVDGRSPLYVTNNSYASCIFEVVAGGGAGSSARITSSNRDDRSVTLDSAIAGLDSTSIYRIYQLAKFPRRCDIIIDRSGTTVYKTIPDAVRRATAAQVQYFIEMGAEYFAGQDADISSERIMSYSYDSGSSSNGNTQSSLVKLISPKARALLRGITNRRGQMVVD